MYKKFIDNVKSFTINELINKLSIRLRNIYTNIFINKKLVSKARKQKLLLKEKSNLFVDYPEVGFIFQTHNKGINLKRLLSPFINKIKAKNIIFFVDCCIDNTYKIASKLLLGKYHFIISCNDRHEIANYRLAADILVKMKCKYIMLFQDDDFYDEALLKWIDNCIKYMEIDDKLSIIGLNNGTQLSKDCYFEFADEGLLNTRFENLKINRNGVQIEQYKLGKYQKINKVIIKPSQDASNFVYCASVNRSPQFIRLYDVIELGFFPSILEPYQYDDYFNCFTAWLNGKKVMLASISGKVPNIGVGGMRLFNNVTVNNRPQHFIKNHNHIVDLFGDSIKNGTIEKLVINASKDSLI